MSFITAHSFTFNGINSIDYGLTIVWIGSSDIDVSTNGLSRDIKKSVNPNRIKSNIYGAENTDVITFNFSIAKLNGEEITRPESIKINQWLTSSSLPQKLHFNDSDPYPLHYYAVCTQIKDIIVGGRLIGKELSFETNSPYAFTRKSEKTFVIINESTDEVTYSKTFSINNSADTYNGIYYPVITIVTRSDDAIIIENITDQKSVTLNTVYITQDNEGNKILKLDCEKMTILDKDNKLLPAEKLGWDNSYKSYVSAIDDYISNIYWLRLLKGINEIKVTGNCTFKIEYEYPRKAGCL
ncbi:MAG: hypothetical protein J1D87_08230 [Lachnospiraceae bacterium]|nr:hypothetical protein [Lachnospiraceae bacterium]